MAAPTSSQKAAPEVLNSGRKDGQKILLLSTTCRAKDVWLSPLPKLWSGGWWGQSEATALLKPPGRSTRAREIKVFLGNAATHQCIHCSCRERWRPSAFLLWSMATSLCLGMKAAGNGNKFDFVFVLQDQRVRHPACLCAKSFSVLRRWKKKKCFTSPAGKQRHSDLSRETKEKEDSHISLKLGACSCFCTVHPDIPEKSPL